MKYTRLYSDASGESHFEDVSLEMVDGGVIGWLSNTQSAAGVIFRHTTGDYDYPWHNAPRQQYVVMLRGAVEIEVSDGEVRCFGPGDIVLLEDVTGKGHYSRAINGQARDSLFIPIGAV